MTGVTLPTGIANMTSGALLTGIAILAAAAFQAGYVEKFRWRVWPGLPLYTSIFGTLAAVAALETFAYLAAKGIVDASWQPEAALAATTVVVLGVLWTLATSRKPRRFGRRSAPRFEKAVAEAFARNRPEELRLLERELAATWADVVAHALHWGSWEARRWAGKREQRQGQRSAWIAVRLMNRMADEAMIAAISAAQGEIVCKTIAEINATERRLRYGQRLRAEYTPAVEMEEQMLGALTRQAMRKEDKLIRRERLGEGPRRDELHPTQTRWAGGVLDRIWGDGAMAVRHRVSDWTSSHLLAGTPVDPEKADQITLTLIDTLLKVGEQPYGGPQLRELIEHRLMMERESEEQTSDSGSDVFMRWVNNTIVARERHETGAGGDRWSAGARKPEEYVRDLAGGFEHYAQGAVSKQGYAAWSAWLNCRGGDAATGSKGDDDSWASRIQRELDGLLWSNHLKWIGRGLPGNMRLLGFYLRMEGMGPEEPLLGRGMGARTNRRRRAIRRAVRRACQRRLCGVLRKTPALADSLCGDGLSVNDDMTLLTYQRLPHAEKRTLALRPPDKP